MTIADGTEVSGRAIVLASGVTYRRVGVPEIEALVGSGVFYGSSVGEAHACAGKHVHVVGGGNSAGQAALYLARACGTRHDPRPRAVARGVDVAVPPRRDRRRATRRCRVTAPRSSGGGGRTRLDHLVIRDVDSGEERTVETGALFLLIGAYPHTAWLPDVIGRDKAGYVLTGVDVHLRQDDHVCGPHETCVPGIFAVGDVRARSVKRVASAVGEGSIVIQQVGRTVSRLTNCQLRP